MRLSIFATAAIVLPFVAAQSTTSVEAAVSTVAADSTAADIDLFAYEQLQLLPSDLEQLNETMAALFAPDNSTAVSATEKRGTTCKTVPGDLLWPIPLVWDLFNVLVGGKLIKAVPIASPCYKGPLYVSNCLRNDNATETDGLLECSSLRLCHCSVRKL